MRRCVVLASTALFGSAMVLVGACSSDTETNGTGGATTTSSGGTTGAAGSGGQGNAAGQGGETGGTGGTGTGGSGGGDSGFDCGDDGLTCHAPQICVTFVVTAGPTETRTWECHDDPCAPEPLSCECAGDVLCEGDPGVNCQLNQDQIECHSGGVCAAPDTAIATPSGDRAIAELAVGDWVYSVQQGRLQAVPIARISRTPVQDHTVAEVTLSNGATLHISVGHPTADGRLFRDLEPGAALGAQQVVSVATVPYAAAHTYDILPASDTGTYVAGGALIGSTLRAR